MRYWKPKPLGEHVSIGIGATAFLPDARRAASATSFIASLQAQTFPRWELVMIHDGPMEVAWQPPYDQRIRFWCHPQRLGKYGHPLRSLMLAELVQRHPWVLLTNDDNYYVPTFLEWMLFEGEAREAALVFCDVVHSHHFWKPMSTQMRRGSIDLGCAIVRSSLAAQVPFDRLDFAADAFWLLKLADLAGSRVVHLDACLMVHN